MEADGNELNDNLFDEVKNEANEERDEDFVHCFLPWPCCAILCGIDVVVRHCRKEGYFNGQPPEKQSCWQLKLLTHVSPFLTVVGEEARDEADGPWE